MYFQFGEHRNELMGAEMGEDLLDGIPDALLLDIFNRLDDIKSLGRCRAVSKRFNGLVGQVENAVVKVDCVISGEDQHGPNGKGRGMLGNLVRLLAGSIVKPLQALQQLLGPKKASAAEVSHHSPGEVLRNFKQIRHLRIELPGGELGVQDGVVLKWKAEFGATLESCVILGASSVARKGWRKGESRRIFVEDANSGMYGAAETENSGGSGPEEDGVPEPFHANGGLKMRVVWTISSLIAASARHYLLREIICEHPHLERLVLTDSERQGTLCMGKQQLCEFRDKPPMVSPATNRTQVPPLDMKLWYAPCLELPGGTRAKGATLVAIRPSDRPILKKDTENFIGGAFEEPFRTAAKAMAKGRTYVLEMNSF